MATGLLGVTSGLAIAKETTFGTPVTTTRGIPIISEGLQLTPARVRATTARGGGLLHPHTDTRVGPVQGAGPIATYLYANGATLLWEAMLGANVTTGTNPYTHTANLAATLPSYSCQVAMGRVLNTRVKKIEGLMVGGWEVAVTQGQYVTLSLDTVFENGDEVVTGEAADDLAGTFAANMVKFLAEEVVVVFGGVTACLQSFRLRGNNNLKVEHCLGSRFITKPVRNARPAVDGEMVIKLDDTSNVLYDAFVAGSVLDLVATCTAGTSTCTMTLTAVAEGSSATVAGEAELMLTIPFMVEVDDAAAETDVNALTVVTVNADATA